MDLKKLKIVFVDGFKIRNTLDDDFGIIHTHSTDITEYVPKFFIPEGEVWIDHRCKDETDFLIEVEDFVLRHVDTMSYTNELRPLMKEKLCLSGAVPEFKQPKEIIDGISVVYVDGGIVRKYLDPDFILGGHDLVYSYIPEKQMWIDTKMDSEEIPYILLHEKIERELMIKGKAYEVAHDLATAYDKEMRRTDGVGIYPTDPLYTWHTMTNEEIIKKYYVRT